MRQKLIINGVEYCQYEVDKNILFLHITNKFPGRTDGDSELICCDILQKILNNHFRGISYLNVNAG